MKPTSITLAEGNGGEENQTLISDLFFKTLSNEILDRAEDAAVIEEGSLAFTTDSFTVSPLFFPGGDIGKLAVCGTCNDLAMMGARPRYLSLAVILEEGFERAKLQKIVQSLGAELRKNGANVVTGDTKVVPKGSVDGVFLNTSGVGSILLPHLGVSKIQKGDHLLVSRDIGRHGAAIFIQREGIELESSLLSDCTSLWPMVERLLQEGITPHAMRDATRGGIASVLNEWAKGADCSPVIEEHALPISDEVLGICEMLGFEATALANEGTFLLALDPSQSERAVSILREFEGNEAACVIGEVQDRYPGRVVLRSEWGTSRFLELPSGELLPRIC